jgi:hypothetical protein
MDVSHEDFFGSSFFGDLIQGLEDAAVFWAGCDFLKVRVFPTSLKNFLVPEVILSRVDGSALLFLDVDLVVVVVFVGDHPALTVEHATRSKPIAVRIAMMRGI